MPIKLQEWRSDNHALLELFIQNNQLQLTYDHAIYSYGIKYKPFLAGFGCLDTDEVKQASSVLVLGSGLGSIPQILHKLYPNPSRHYTIVDIDAVILDLCSQHLSALGIKNCTYIREDALDYVSRAGAGQFDVVCLDIFKDIEVPEDFLTSSFISALATTMKDKGRLVFNYIEHNAATTQLLSATLLHVFSSVSSVDYRKNLIWLAKK